MPTSHAQSGAIVTGCWFHQKLDASMLIVARQGVVSAGDRRALAKYGRVIGPNVALLGRSRAEITRSEGLTML